MSTITLHKEKKDREVGLFCLRDKIVQQSLANELHKLYDDHFVEESYAFHSRRSALDAVAKVEKTVTGQGEYWVLKTDVSHFFDEIDHEILLELLKQKVRDEEAMELLGNFLTVPSLNEDGELQDKSRGIYQGSTIAPLLSNIYLDRFDYQIREQVMVYCRYADDMSKNVVLDYSMNEDEIQLYYQYFAGREDIYACESVNPYGKRCYEMVKEPLTVEILNAHYEKGISLGTYVQRSNGTVHYLVFDLDISKKVLLKYSPDTKEFEQ